MTLRYVITKKIGRKEAIYRCLDCGEYGANDLRETVNMRIPEWYRRLNLVSHGLCREDYRRLSKRGPVE